LGGQGGSPETLWGSQTNLFQHIKLIKHYVYSPQTHVCIMRKTKTATFSGGAFSSVEVMFTRD
jgi:hypothetical protein